MSDTAGRELDVVRRKYDRIAPVYELLESFMELRFRGWRRLIWELVDGGRILEIGVGTGKNIPFYPRAAAVTAIDIAPQMLARAESRARRSPCAVTLEVADAQELPYPDASFDVVIATFVFCSIPDPRRALAEAKRVLRPDGRLLLLEHVLSRRPVLRSLMRLLDPLPYRIWGAHIDRETVTYVEDCGFGSVDVARRSLDIVVQIEARDPNTRTLSSGQEESA